MNVNIALRRKYVICKKNTTDGNFLFLREKIGVVIGNGTVSHKVGSVSSDVDNSPSIKPPSSPRPILVRCNSKNQKRRTGNLLS